jgi:hypothetical protein
LYSFNPARLGSRIYENVAVPFSPASYETEKSSFENKDLVFFFHPVVCFSITHLRLQRSQVFAFSRMVYYLSRAAGGDRGVVATRERSGTHVKQINKQCKFAQAKGSINPHRAQSSARRALSLKHTSKDEELEKLLPLVAERERE